jgi:hypothetical protein
MNLSLFSSGYPIIIVKNKERDKYMNSLEALHLDLKDTTFFRLMLQFLQENFDLYKTLYDQKTACKNVI